MYVDRKILITGGTGTIGRMLIHRLLQANPAVIRIFSRDEHKQYEMQQEFSDSKNLRFLIGDVRDQERLSRAMEDVDYVFHLAAMKHVPSCEYNPFEAVQTNVMGTQNVIQAAIRNRVKKVLFTSTDKAISPTNTYGATKLTGERLISAAEYQKGPRATIFSSVRFGNVMGSRGSVIPLFKKQILEKRCLTITSRDMVRYMMTPTQAISLMLEANELAQGGEVFVLKMPVVRLTDLAEVMIELVNGKYNVQGDTAIREIGLRPGEKMYEELLTDEEYRQAIESENMFIVPSFFRDKTAADYGVRPLPKLSKGNEIPAPIPKETLRSWIVSEKLV